MDINDVQRIVGGLYMELHMLREAHAKLQRTVKVDVSKDDDGGSGPCDQQGPEPTEAR